MSPEIFTNERDPDGSIRIIYGFSSHFGFNLEHRSDGGWWLTFDYKYQVCDFLQNLAQHVNLPQPLSDEEQSSFINQFVLQLRGETEKGDPATVCFSPKELTGVTPSHHGITLRYADQKTVNKTFFELLPYNTFHGFHETDTSASRLEQFLKVLGILNQPTLDRIASEMPPYKHPDPKNWDNNGNPMRIVRATMDRLPGIE